VRVAVTDNGAGISPEALPRIFDPFYTSKPVGTGTCLGLSVCHGIITGLGGEISVESAPGRGTTVRVDLPVAARARTPQGRQPDSKTRRARVLIVDDEVLLLDIIQRVLAPDHDVTTARDGEEALLHIAQQPAYDFIFCDLMMPGMSGMDLYARLERTHPELARRVVFLTGGAVTTAAMRLLEQASNEVIAKPFDLDQISRYIEERFR